MNQPKNSRPPDLPLVLWMNRAVLNFYFMAFQKKYLSGYEVDEIDGNTRDGNGPQSHGLEKVFNLYRGGSSVPFAEQEAVFQTVKDKWNGPAAHTSEGIVISLPTSLTPVSTVYAGTVGMIILGNGLKKTFSPQPQVKG